MELELKDKVKKAVKAYMHRMRDVEFLDEVNDFLIFEEEGEVVVFVAVSAETGSFPRVSRNRLRNEFEDAMILWFSEPENRDKVDFPIRCDSAEVNIMGKDRALVRHVVNAFGSGDYHDWH